MLLLSAVAHALAIVTVRYHRWHSTPLRLQPWQLLVAAVPLALAALAGSDDPWNAVVHDPETLERLLATDGQIDSTRMRSGLLEQRDWIALTKSAGRIAEAKGLIAIDDDSGPTITDIRAKARRWRVWAGSRAWPLARMSPAVPVTVVALYLMTEP